MASNIDKWKISIFSAILFIIVANSYSRKYIYLLSKTVEIDSIIISTILFTLIVRASMDFNIL